MIGGWRHGYAHHGIVVVDESGTQVVDFCTFLRSPTRDKRIRDAKIRITPSEQFLLGHSTFGVVPYTVAEARPGHRERTVALARAFLADPTGSLPVYDLIRWNCECFAWVCKTGGHQSTSDRDGVALGNGVANRDGVALGKGVANQIGRILRAIRHDACKARLAGFAGNLSKGSESFLIQCGGASSGSCIIS
jgi:hypothetical protein